MIPFLLLPRWITVVTIAYWDGPFGDKGQAMCTFRSTRVKGFNI